MITLQEAERLLEKFAQSRGFGDAASVKASASDFLTTLTSAGAFQKLDAAEVSRSLMAEGVTQSATAYVIRVLRKHGVVA